MVGTRNLEINGFFYIVHSIPEVIDETQKPKKEPAFVSRPESIEVEEGEWARFCCRVTGHPKPRVMWLINGHTVVNVSVKNHGIPGKTIFANAFVCSCYQPFAGSTL